MSSDDAVPDVVPLPKVSTPEERAALERAERDVPTLNRPAEIPPERQVRYAWAASVLAGRSVLDAACGMGWGTAVLATRAARVVGIDISPPAVAVARRSHGGEAEFRVGDVQDLPFGEGEFEAVVCFEAIERVPRHEAAFGEFRRVLAPGGLLLVSAANRDVYPPGNPFHLREFTDDELRAALSRYFTNVAVYRQHSCSASLLISDHGTSGDLTAAPAEVGVDGLGKVVSRRAAYAMVAASDGDLPAPPATAALSPGADCDEQQRLLESWRQRALAAELELRALRTEMQFGSAD